MLKQSVFIAECLCGRTLESPTREYICPDCRRHIVFEWGHEPGPEAEPERPNEKPSTSESA
jgi:hypothetical protein